MLSVALLAQTALMHGFVRSEYVPENTVLKSLAASLGNWRLYQEGQIEQEVLDVLKADDTLTRTYVDTGSGASAHLFVAFFRSQRAGRAPHSPKNCLPGSGWVPSLSDTVSVDLPGREAVKVNRYVVQKGESRSLVLYWYQSRDRVVASEYEAKFYVVADALRYNRTDTALVRVIVPIAGEGSEAVQRAQETAFSFVRNSFAPLRQQFPA